MLTVFAKMSECAKQKMGPRKAFKDHRRCRQMGRGDRMEDNTLELNLTKLQSIDNPKGCCEAVLWVGRRMVRNGMRNIPRML